MAFWSISTGSAAYAATASQLLEFGPDGKFIREIGHNLYAWSFAHDVRIGSHTVLANGVTFGGHATVEDWAVIGAFSGVHQFCRVGRHSMTGGYSVITQDVLPYSLISSPREPKVYGVNKTGLERRGFTVEAIAQLQKAFRTLTKSGLNTSQALERIAAEAGDAPEVVELMAFIHSASRGFVK